MDFIKNLHGKVKHSIDSINTVKQVMEAQDVSIDEARDIVKNKTFMDYMNESDNPFGEFSKPGEVPGQKNNMHIDPDKLQIGDMVKYVNRSGREETGKIADDPDQAGRINIAPEMGEMEDEVTVRDILGPDEEEIQQELQRMQELAGIGYGGVEPDMEESATGGATGAGAVGGAAKRINPLSRQHSPYGKAYKSARSKTSEFKRTPHKRGPKK